MIEGTLAQALGLSRSAPETTVAERLVQQASGAVKAAQVSADASTWLVGVAEALGEYLPTGLDGRRRKSLDAIAESVAADQMTTLHRQIAPAVLAVIAPYRIVGGCAAMDLHMACKALVRTELAGFCRRVLSTWEYEHSIDEVDAEVMH